MDVLQLALFRDALLLDRGLLPRLPLAQRAVVDRGRRGRRGFGQGLGEKLGVRRLLLRLPEIAAEIRRVLRLHAAHHVALGILRGHAAHHVALGLLSGHAAHHVAHHVALVGLIRCGRRGRGLRRAHHHRLRVLARELGRERLLRGKFGRELLRRRAGLEGHAREVVRARRGGALPGQGRGNGGGIACGF